MTRAAASNGYDYMLGSTFLQHLDTPILTLGKLRITRRTMATELGLATPGAIRRFATLCSDLNIKSASDLLRVAPVDLADVKGIGVTTLYVAIRVLQHAGFDVNAWYERGTPENHVTFSTLKHRVASPERRRASRKARTARAR